MNKIHSVVGALTILLASTQSALAVTTALPVEDGGLLLVAAAGLAVAIKIARFKQKR